MQDRCDYCGRAHDPERNITVGECPVCGALHCPLCGTIVEFLEATGQMEDGHLMVRVYRGRVCMIHIPWNIKEGIKKGAEQNES